MRTRNVTPVALVILTLLTALSPHSSRADDRLPIPAGKACPLSTDFAIPGTFDGPLAYPWNVIWAEYMRIGGPNGPIGCPWGGFNRDSAAGAGFMVSFR